MKTTCSTYRSSVRQPPRSASPRPRAPGFPWTLAYSNRWIVSVVSHSTLAALTAVLVMVMRPALPDPGPSPSERSPSSAPRELAVELRGSSSSTHGADVPRLASHGQLDIVARHDGRRSEQARLWVQAQRLTDAAVQGQPGVFLVLDPRYGVWRERSFHFHGRVDETLPLAPGLWRLTFMISDPRQCHERSLHACARAHTWVRVT